MATRGYTVGSQPPQVTWTIVRGDTASFRVYVTDDARQPINVPDWTIDMDITRLGSIVTSLIPEATIDAMMESLRYP